MAELSLAKLSAHFWLNCLNFKSVELSLAELSGRVSATWVHATFIYFLQETHFKVENCSIINVLEQNLAVFSKSARLFYFVEKKNTFSQ